VYKPTGFAWGRLIQGMGNQTYKCDNKINAILPSNK